MSHSTLASPAAASSAGAVGPAPPAQGRTSIPTAPCYCCGSRMGVPAPAYWGFFLPGLLDHVQCVRCPVTYNARTGESNDPLIVLLHAGYAAALLLALMIALAAR